MSANTEGTLKDVSHTPPSGESVVAVWARGRDEPTEE
jgi:hypothetical protein